MAKRNLCARELRVDDLPGPGEEMSVEAGVHLMTELPDLQIEVADPSVEVLFVCAVSRLPPSAQTKPVKTRR